MLKSVTSIDTDVVEKIVTYPCSNSKVSIKATIFFMYFQGFIKNIII